MKSISIGKPLQLGASIVFGDIDQAGQLGCRAGVLRLYEPVHFSWEKPHKLRHKVPFQSMPICRLIGTCRRQTQSPLHWSVLDQTFRQDIEGRCPHGTADGSQSLGSLRIAQGDSFLVGGVPSNHA
jgi:hypothetical protein